MLLDIRIRGLGVITDAVLEFGPGLTVVTGETGAGKTMVVTGLALLFGGRADSSRLGPGVQHASVEGRLSVESDGSLAKAVADAGGDLDEETLILRRVISANGRSRAVAGGASVPASLLAGLAKDLVTLHGQSDQLRLTQPGEQRATLDRYARLDVGPCRQAYAHWQQAEQELRRRQAGARELARESDLLRAGLSEIEAVAPVAGEDRELAESSARLEHADSLRAAAHTARAALSTDAESAEVGPADIQGLLGTALKALELVAGTDGQLDDLAARLTTLSTDADDIAAGLADYELHLDADPGQLATVFARRAALQTLIRRYGPELQDVLHWAEQARLRLADTDTSSEVMAGLVRDREERQARFAEMAGTLSRQRRLAATELASRVTAELAGLGMPAAELEIAVRARPIDTGAGPEGIDEIEFILRAHQDAPALPIQRGASGGELSRVMLAIEVALAGTDPVPTMVFDEVDAGVGGRAAVEVGRRLAQLSRAHQVIVVTHLAQVAAFAEHHLVVDKQLSSTDAPGLTHSDIRAVSGEARVAELARMLAGDDTAAARTHAAELLAGAADERHAAK